MAATQLVAAFDEPSSKLLTRSRKEVAKRSHERRLVVTPVQSTAGMRLTKFRRGSRQLGKLGFQKLDQSTLRRFFAHSHIHTVLSPATICPIENPRGGRPHRMWARSSAVDCMA